MTVKFNDAVGAAVLVIALLVVAYAAVFLADEGSRVAMVGIASGGAGYFMRGKVQVPAP